MAKKKTSKAPKRGHAIDYAERYEKVKGRPQDRVAKLAKEFGVDAARVKAALRLEWSGKDYRKVFGGRQSFQYSLEHVLKALNQYGTVGMASKKLKVNAVTLAARIKLWEIQKEVRYYVKK